MKKIIKEFDQQIPEFLRVLEVGLRSGYSLVQSLEMVVKDMNTPMATETQQVLDDMKTGLPLLEALNLWLVRMPSQTLDLIIAAFNVQFEAGGNLADKLQFIAQILPKLKLRPV